ncbi:MAG: AI-2E family transporter [Bryobacteraceae bacterium]
MPGHSVRTSREANSSPILPVLTAVIVIAALYFFKELLIPFALALLFSFLLTPAVTWLERLRLGRMPSVLLVLVIGFSIAGGLLWMGTEQLSEIVEQLPQYRTNIREKLEAFGSPHSSGIMKAAATIEQLKSQITAKSSGTKSQGNAARRLNAQRRADGEPEKVQPVPVEIVQQQHTGILGSLGIVSTSLVRVLGTGAAVIVLTLFMLINRSQIRNRAFRLFGEGRLVMMTTAMDDAAERVSRYLLTQSAVNGSFGTLLGVGLYFIGVPFAPFWGVFGAAMRFIPYAGTLVAGGCPFLLSLAVFHGWQRPLMVLGVFAAIEVTTSGLIEPWLYSTRTGISSLAILLSAAFWTLLWGPIGLILSTPLTVCLAVLGRHIPPLEFLYVLLGDEPALSPEQHYYQRLLAMDEDEAAEVVERFSRDKPLIEVYDSVVIPALQMTRTDLQQNRIDDERARFIYQNVRELIDDLGARPIPEEPAQEPIPYGQISMLCLPARSQTDELVGLMLVQIARRNGYTTELLSVEFGEERLARVRESRAGIIVVSALPPFALIRARSLCRRVRELRPEAKVILGLWNSTLPAEKIKERLGSDCSDSVVITLAEAELELKALAAPAEQASEPLAGSANRNA